MHLGNGRIAHPVLRQTKEIGKRVRLNPIEVTSIMAQKLIQTQTQKQVQVQRLSQQQMLQVRLLEMPLTELEQSVAAELDDNPALETNSNEPNDTDNYDAANNNDEQGEEDFDQQTEREEREQALDAALETMKCPKPTAEITIIMPTTRRLCMATQRRFTINSKSRWAK